MPQLTGLNTENKDVKKPGFYVNVAVRVAPLPRSGVLMGLWKGLIIANCLPGSNFLINRRISHV
jgi:hypothetical protein